MAVDRVIADPTLRASRRCRIHPTATSCGENAVHCECPAHPHGCDARVWGVVDAIAHDENALSRAAARSHTSLGLLTEAAAEDLRSLQALAAAGTRVPAAAAALMGQSLPWPAGDRAVGF